VAFCEIEPFCCQVLEYHWPEVPIFGNIRELTKRSLEEAGVDVGAIDVVCGGFPCQSFSRAGKRRGEEDDRYLWPEMFRVVKEVKPNWILSENVVNIVNMALDTVLSDLESEGYETATFVIPACAVGAPHRRDRVWILAHTESARLPKRWSGSIKDSRPLRQTAQDGANPGPSGCCEYGREVAGMRHAESELGMRLDGLPSRLVECAKHRWPAPRGCEQYSWEPPRLAADKTPNRRQKLQALGNAVVPQIVKEIGIAILAAEKNKLLYGRYHR